MKPYYESDLGKLYCGDCLDILPGLDADIGLVFTSPPYNTGNKGKNKNMYTEYVDNMPEAMYIELIEMSLIYSMKACSGLVMYNLNYMRNNQKALDTVAYRLSECRREKIIWDKGRCQPPMGNILGKRYEEIWVFCKEKGYPINIHNVNLGDKYRHIFGNWISNLMTLSNKGDQTEFSGTHRAGFPPSLPSVFVDIYTKEGDIVLDPFCGLGTTAMVCERMNRRWIGIEICEKYCEISAERISHEAVQGRLAL